MNQEEYDQFIFNVLTARYINTPVDTSLLLYIFGLEEQVRSGEVSLILAEYMALKPVPQRIGIIVNFLVELYNRKGINKKGKLSSASGIIQAYFSTENTFNARILLRNKIEMSNRLTAIAKSDVFKIISKVPYQF